MIFAQIPWLYDPQAGCNWDCCPLSNPPLEVWIWSLPLVRLLGKFWQPPQFCVSRARWLLRSKWFGSYVAGTVFQRSHLAPNLEALIFHPEKAGLGPMFLSQPRAESRRARLLRALGIPRNVTRVEHWYCVLRCSFPGIRI